MVLRLTYKGFNYVDYYNGEYHDNDTLSGVAATGANSVALTPDYGIDIADSTIYAGGATTDSAADLTTAIQEANAEGLTSFVRPLIDFLYPQASSAYPGNYYVPNFDSGSNPSGYDPANVPTGVTPATVPASAYSDGDTVNYRGLLSPLDIDVAKFFGTPSQVGSYDKMIVDEAKVAQAAGAKLFSIGTEMDSLATDTDAAVQADWVDLIADVRSVFAGKLTYSANWATANQISFWNKLDYVGIDGYVPLSNTVPTSAAQNPSETSLVAGWNTVSNVTIAYSGGTTVGQQLGGVSAIDYFDQLAQQSISKQFIFSEIGYQNDTGAAADPTGGSNMDVKDPSLQAELYQAFFDAWGGAQQTADTNGGMVDGIKFSLAGAYFWNWNPDTRAASYDDWSPNGYPAANTITTGFTPPGPKVLAETASSAVAGYEGTPFPARGTAGVGGTGVLAGDSDSSNSPLTVSAVAGGTLGSFFNTTYGSLQLNADGSYVYYPDAGSLADAPIGVPAQDEIDFTVTDGNNLSEPATLTITDYRDPVAVETLASVEAGDTVTGTAGTSGTGILAGDSDPDGLALEVSAVYSRQEQSSLEDPTNPNVGDYGTLTYNSDGSYSYTANDPASLAQAAASNNNSLTDYYLPIVSPVGVGNFTNGSIYITVTVAPDIVDTAANIRTYVAGLQADVANIDTITASNGAVTVSEPVFEADGAALDKIVGGFGVSDKASNIVAGIGDLTADAHVKYIVVASGSASLGANASYGGSFVLGAGVVLSLTGGYLLLSGSARLAGATVNGNHRLYVEGSTALAGLTIGGTAVVVNTKTVTQAGGTVAVGDSSGSVASLLNIASGSYAIADNSGITHGNSAGSFVQNLGIFMKVGGTGTSTVAASFRDTGTVTASVGTLAFTGPVNSFAGAITGAGTILLGGGSTTLASGATAKVAALSLSGSGTTVTLNENLTYAGKFSQGAGTSLGIGSGETLTLTGPAGISGSVTGAGRLSLASGVTTLSSGAVLSVAHLAESGAGTKLIVSANVKNTGTFGQGQGATLSLTGGYLLLTGSAAFAGGTVNGSQRLYVEGAATISGLTIGGTVLVEDTKTVTQAGGSVTVGDTAGNAAVLDNAAGATYDITDDSGIARGSATGSHILNNGLFEKTGGSGTSTITPSLVNTGTLEAISGVLDLKGAVTGTGAGKIVGASTLKFDGAVASGQTIAFSGSGGVLELGTPQGFAGKVSGFASNETIKLDGAFVFKSFTENGARTQGTLTVANGGVTASIALLGNYASNQFQFASQGGNTLIT